MAKLTSARVMREFGLTKREFRSEYEIFRRRVQNFNRITGFNYSPLKEFRYSKLYPENATIKAIKEITSTPNKQTFKTVQTAENYVLGRFRGLINSSIELQQYEQQLKQGKITIEDFTNKAKQIGEYLAEKREKYPAVAGSEEIIQGTYLSNNLVQENENLIADEIF